MAKILRKKKVGHHYFVTVTGNTAYKRRRPKDDEKDDDMGAISITQLRAVRADNKIDRVQGRTALVHVSIPYAQIMYLDDFAMSVKNDPSVADVTMGDLIEEAINLFMTVHPLTPDEPISDV